MNTMTKHASIELHDLRLATKIGTYGPAHVIPREHVLDLTLILAPGLVQIAADNMALVFDYDPLIEDIERIAAAHHFETQEYLISCIAQACATYAEVADLEIYLRKGPVRSGSGTLGLRLTLSAADVAALRTRSAPSA